MALMPLARLPSIVLYLITARIASSHLCRARDPVALRGLNGHHPTHKHQSRARSPPLAQPPCHLTRTRTHLRCTTANMLLSPLSHTPIATHKGLSTMP
ncbi:hypothetical protein ACCO45_004086 [Purpureocillium lilacinum]|uniref:Uncharacterized protein n=1 Tax=Purpureocillium lilacinum TaxID=33203 RepID=A0ACC4E2K5_PURLI